MLGSKKIIILQLVDKYGKSYPNLTRRIVEHNEEVLKLISDYPVVMGRTTHELTGWKGLNAYVLTKALNWTRNDVDVLRSLDDIQSLKGDTVYVVGGVSLFEQLAEFADEYYIWSLTEGEGTERIIGPDHMMFWPYDVFSNYQWSCSKFKMSRDGNYVSALR